MNSVYVKLIGGLGNQLFQVSNGYGYCRKHNIDNLYLDSSTWFGHQGNNGFTYKDTIFKSFEFGAAITRNIIGIHENNFNYEDFVGDNVCFNGYFQSLKYFEGYQEDFKDLLILPNVDRSCIKPKNVAFHIRRGDYLQFKNIHYVCDTEYFNKCFEMFEDYQINVFTDSPEYVLEEFKHQEFNLIQTTSELNDLTLMSLHDNMVISNSSFSWWASFLGKKKERIISPSKWFADGREATDIFRNEFIRI